jgi:hypothetical protein
MFFVVFCFAKKKLTRTCLMNAAWSRAAASLRSKPLLPAVASPTDEMGFAALLTDAKFRDGTVGIETLAAAADAAATAAAVVGMYGCNVWPLPAPLSRYISRAVEAPL